MNWPSVQKCGISVIGRWRQFPLEDTWDALPGFSHRNRQILHEAGRPFRSVHGFRLAWISAARLGPRRPSSMIAIDRFSVGSCVHGAGADRGPSLSQTCPMPSAESDAPIRFLRTAFEPTDWVAVFLKSYERGTVAQRVAALAAVETERFQRWLRAMNAARYNVFVSVNAIAPGCRARTRDAIGDVRHVFLDADHDGRATLLRVSGRSDLPRPSYVLHSSPDHVHIFWRVGGFDHASVERLQKHLARELQTDPAATPVTQTTRLPGFFNHKRAQPHLVTVEYLDVNARYRPEDFPTPAEPPSWTPTRRPLVSALVAPAVERARRYLESVPPAIAGQHGDVHTFRICCRLVRGFALNDDQALDVLSDWNERCQPPWSAGELRDKLRRAARYGREPVGGLL